MASKRRDEPLIGDPEYERAQEKCPSKSYLGNLLTKTTTKNGKIKEQNAVIARLEFEVEKAQVRMKELELENQDLHRNNERLQLETSQLRNTLLSAHNQLETTEAFAERILQILDGIVVVHTKTLKSVPDLNVLQQTTHHLENQLRELVESEAKLREEGEILLGEFINLKTNVPEMETLCLEYSSLRKKLRKAEREREHYESYSKCLVKAQARKEMHKPPPDSQYHLCLLCDQELSEIANRPSGNDRDLFILLDKVHGTPPCDDLSCLDKGCNTELSCVDEEHEVEKLHSCIAELMNHLEDATNKAAQKESQLKELSRFLTEANKPT